MKILNDYLVSKQWYFSVYLEGDEYMTVWADYDANSNSLKIEVLDNVMSEEDEQKIVDYIREKHFKEYN